ncbi:extracellular solute-binding protein [Microbacterium sp.]|uniref:extracellular solute-binding protein n=1 Tax=Microbacterium sp. TaxID=51671 RepID=UPI002732DD71|nr:extracellular solute-binding protein [Microbacterium sp.]MDP3951866.1 extracellular solute-binding protein [Microbacterium sp.]
MKRSSGVLGLSAATLLALSACSPATPSDGAAAEDIVLTWEGTAAAAERKKEAWQDPFTAETGIEFENVSSPSAVNQIKTMVETGNVVWDIAHKGSYTAEQYCGELFEELEFLSTPEDVYPEGASTDCSRPVSKYGAAFAYDVTVYTDEVPTEIEDFFDVEEFAGKRVILGTNARGVLEAALVADGVDPEELFPLDVDRALAKLDTIKEHIIFAPTLTALQQNLVDKQASMSIALTNTYPAINDGGATMTPVWDFTTWDFDALLVIKGSKNPEAAQQAIEFALQPERVIAYAELGGSTPAREGIDLSTIDYTDSQRLFNPFLGEVLGEDRGTLALQDPKWWAENSASASEAYVAWQVG